MKRITILLAATLLLAACTNEDPQAPGTGTLPAATITISGIAGPTTRTATDPVKTTFDAGDAIDIVYYNGNQQMAASTTVGHIDAGTAPTLYINADTARIVARYTPADPADSYADHLQATSEALEPGSPAGITYNPDGTATITFHFLHTRCLVQMGTVKDVGGTDLALDATAPITLAGRDPETSAAKNIELIDGKAILPPGFIIESVTFTLANGKQYTAYPHGEPGSSASLAAEGGKIHPINITLAGDVATIATPAEGEITSWNTAEEPRIIPPGYDRAIYTEADLVAFWEATNYDDPNDPNADATRAAACREKVIQMADITLSEAWNKPIANFGTGFTGEYNGNGYTITGLTMDVPDKNIALFNQADGATLIGIHLRDVEITGGNAAALVVNTFNTTISLCSATGRVTGSNLAGGLAVNIYYGSTLLRSRTNCTVTANGGTDRYAGGLAASNGNGIILGCMAGGSVEGTAGIKGGLLGKNDGTSGTIYHSYTTTPGVGLIGESYLLTDTYIRSSYSADKAYDANGAQTTSTTPGDVVRAGSHDVGGMRYVGTDIWSAGDRPTLMYSYAGEAVVVIPEP